jgi:hypothetical protein
VLEVDADPAAHVFRAIAVAACCLRDRSLQQLKANQTPRMVKPSAA